MLHGEGIGGGGTADPGGAVGESSQQSHAFFLFGPAIETPRSVLLGRQLKTLAPWVIYENVVRETPMYEQVYYRKHSW